MAFISCRCISPCHRTLSISVTSKDMSQVVSYSSFFLSCHLSRFSFYINKSHRRWYYKKIRNKQFNNQVYCALSRYFNKFIYDSASVSKARIILKISQDFNLFLFVEYNRVLGLDLQIVPVIIIYKI